MEGEDPWQTWLVGGVLGPAGDMIVDHPVNQEEKKPSLRQGVMVVFRITEVMTWAVSSSFSLWRRTYPKDRIRIHLTHFLFRSLLRSLYRSCSDTRSRSLV